MSVTKRKVQYLRIDLFKAAMRRRLGAFEQP